MNSIKSSDLARFGQKVANHNAAHTALVKACADVLRYRGCLPIPIQAGGAWVRNGRGGYRPIKLACGGTCDLIGVCPGGVTLYIECKTGDGRLTQTQRLFRDDVLARGHRWLEVRDSIDELERELMALEKRT